MLGEFRTRWLLLDVGGVLADVDDAVWPGEFAARWAQRLDLSLEQFIARIEAANLPEATVRDDVEEEYWEGYAAAVGADGSVLAEMRADFWDAYCGEPNRELIAFLRTLTGRVPMAILSTSGALTWLHAPGAGAP